MIEGNRLMPGAVVNRSYRVLHFLGEGGFGVTYAAEDLSNGMVYALKEYFPQEFAIRRSDGRVIPISDRQNEFFKYIDYFNAESLHLSQFDHPNIISVIARFDSNGTSYFVMEFVPGRKLSDEVMISGHLDSDSTLLVAENLIDALKNVHDQGLIHRDVKPNNVMLGTVVSPRRTKLKNLSRDTMMKFGKPILLDFGSARIVEAHGTPMTCLVSPGFSAPEQWDHHARQTPLVDIYGLAATLYFCLCGEDPPAAIDRKDGASMEPASSRFANFASAKLNKAIDKALSLDPSLRQKNIREFREDIFS